MSVTSKPDQAQPWWRRWGRTTAELDDELLQRSAKRHGATPIQVCELGQRCHVRGVLQSVTLRPQAGVPAVSAQLYDGTATVTLMTLTTLVTAAFVAWVSWLRTNTAPVWRGLKKQ